MKDYFRAGLTSLTKQKYLSYPTQYILSEFNFRSCIERSGLIVFISALPYSTRYYGLFGPLFPCTYAQHLSVLRALSRIDNYAQNFTQTFLIPSCLLPIYRQARVSTKLYEIFLIRRLECKIDLPESSMYSRIVSRFPHSNFHPKLHSWICWDGIWTKEDSYSLVFVLLSTVLVVSPIPNIVPTVRSHMSRW